MEEKREMEKFYLDRFLTEGRRQREGKIGFSELCELVRQFFLQEWENDPDRMERAAEIQKKAIIGYEKEVAFFCGKIRRILRLCQAGQTEYPPWYGSLEEAVYHENWGLAGIAEWFSPAFRDSSSAKVIGDRIYFLEEGRMVLKPQRIPPVRREQLVRAFLLLSPEERMDRDSHEIYLLDGTRVTIFRGNLVKQDQDVIVFRRYLIPEYTFEEQAKRGTIPWDAIPLFRAMIRLGYNVAFTGAVRSSKSTFLSTWQSYEDPDLEGLMVETDPEIPLHRIMPGAPVIQLLADNEKLRTVTKKILRSDADYLVMGEARDGTALDTALKMASKGTRRMKITFHLRNPYDFPYDVAGEIVKAMGGELPYIAACAASSFDYLFHFIQLKEKNKKRLKGIYEISCSRDREEIRIRRICRYRPGQDDWQWEYHIGEEKKEAGEEEDPDAFRIFSEQLARLSEKNGSREEQGEKQKEEAS